MQAFLTKLFLVSAVLLGAWFAGLHALWQDPPPVTAQDPPKPIETLVQQKVGEVAGQRAAAESMPP